MEARERAYDPAIHILLVPEKNVDARAAKFYAACAKLGCTRGHDAERLSPNNWKTLYRSA